MSSIKGFGLGTWKAAWKTGLWLWNAVSFRWCKEGRCCTRRWDHVDEYFKQKETSQMVDQELERYQREAAANYKRERDPAKEHPDLSAEDAVLHNSSQTGTRSGQAGEGSLSAQNAPAAWIPSGYYENVDGREVWVDGNADPGQQNSRRLVDLDPSTPFTKAQMAQLHPGRRPGSAIPLPREDPGRRLISDNSEATSPHPAVLLAGSVPILCIIRQLYLRCRDSYKRRTE